MQSAALLASVLKIDVIGLMHVCNSRASQACDVLSQ